MQGVLNTCTAGQYICSEQYQETPKLKIKMFITETVNNNNYTKSELSAEENMYTIMTVFLQWMNDKLL